MASSGDLEAIDSIIGLESSRWIAELPTQISWDPPRALLEAKVVRALHVVDLRSLAVSAAELEQQAQAEAQIVQQRRDRSDAEALLPESACVCIVIENRGDQGIAFLERVRQGSAVYAYQRHTWGLSFRDIENEFLRVRKAVWQFIICRVPAIGTIFVLGSSGDMAPEACYVRRLTGFGRSGVTPAGSFLSCGEQSKAGSALPVGFTPVVQPPSPTAHGEMVERYFHRLNHKSHMHVKQFVANVQAWSHVVQSLQASKYDMSEVKAIDVYCYPVGRGIVEVPADVSPPSARKALMKVLDDTSGLTAAAQRMLEQEHELRTADREVLEIPPSGSVRTLLREIRRQYPDFNARVVSNPVEFLEGVCRQEGLRVSRIPQMSVLSAIIVVYRADRMEVSLAVRSDEQIHPLLSAFLIGHELGHWFIHIKPYLNLASLPRHMIEFSNSLVFYHSYQDRYGTKEHQADLVPLLCLMPTPVLLHLENAGVLTPDVLVQWMISAYRGTSEILSERLRSTMREYASKRIEIFRHHASLHLNMPVLRRMPMDFRDLDALKTLWRGEKWSVLGPDGSYIDVSAEFATMLGRGRGEIVGRQASMFTARGVVDTSSINDQLQYQRNSAKWIRTITTYQTPTGPRLCMVYAAPAHAEDQTLVSIALIEERTTY